MRTENIGGISFPVPDDLKNMSEEQLKRYFSVTENLAGFYRQSDNTMMAVGYTPKKLLVSMFFSAKDIVKNYDRGFSGRLRNYKRTGELSREIAGSLCPGISFEFSTQHENVPMKSEVYSVKHKGAFYGIIFIAKQKGGDTEKLASEVIPHITFKE